MATLGIDLGKSTIHVVSLDNGDHPMERKKPTRTSLIRSLAKLTLEDVENGLPDGGRDPTPPHWYRLQDLDDRVTEATQELNQLRWSSASRTSRRPPASSR